MKNTKKYNSELLYIIVVLFSIIVAFSTVHYLNENRLEKQKIYFAENINTLKIIYNSSIEKYNTLMEYYFETEIQNKNILNLFYKGSTASGDKQNLYRGLLYRNLYPIYKKLKLKHLRQFHFHLKDNTSYLRFHKPENYGDNLSKFRNTVTFVNKNKKRIAAFEAGRLFTGFRYIFPIKYQNNHIGSVEFGLSMKYIVETMIKLSNEREYSFIFKKDTIYDKLFKKQKYLYTQSVINPDFLHEDFNQILLDSPKRLSAVAQKINSKLSKDDKLKLAMKNSKTYSINVKIDNTYYTTSLLPIFGIKNNIEGYLISYKKKADTKFISNFNLVTTSIFLALFIFIILVFTIYKKSRNMTNQKNWFESINDTIGEGLYVMDTSGIIKYVNPMACSILGYTKKELTGKCAHSLFHSHYINENISQKDCPILKSVIENQEFYSDKESFTCKDRSIISVDISSKSILKDSDTSQIVTVFRDISENKKIERNMLLLTKALEASSNAIVITDKDALVEWANPAFKTLTGYDIKDVVGKNPSEFANSGNHSKKFFKEMWDTILNKKAWKNEIINKRKDGSLYYEELSITPVLDENNEIQNFIAVKQDISERKKREKDIKHFAFYDTLTNLPNRRLLIEHLEQSMSALARTPKSIAVLFLDLDKFKSLNDTHGHDAGDDLLIQVANRLNNVARKEDIVTRIGGDEFIIVLDHLPRDFNKAKESTKIVSEKIIATIKVPFVLKNITYEITASIGVCIFNDELLKVNNIFKYADTALYEAKEQGRGKVCFYKDLNEDKTI